MPGETLKCLQCEAPIGIKSISDDKVDITPLMPGVIERITIHRTSTKEVEYTAILKCNNCMSKTEITKVV